MKYGNRIAMVGKNQNWRLTKTEKVDFTQRCYEFHILLEYRECYACSLAKCMCISDHMERTWERIVANTKVLWVANRLEAKTLESFGENM